MKKKYQKICEFCKRDFETKDERRVTCSPKCSRENQNPNRPEVRAKQRVFKKQMKKKLQQKIFNRLLKEEREKYGR